MPSHGAKQPFRFLDLPAELRNEMYKYAFNSAFQDTIEARTTSHQTFPTALEPPYDEAIERAVDTSKISLHSFRKALPKPWLTQVSQQLHREALPLLEKACADFFAMHTIQVAFPWGIVEGMDVCKEAAKRNCEMLMKCPGFAVRNLAIRLFLLDNGTTAAALWPKFIDLEVSMFSSTRACLKCSAGNGDGFYTPGYHQIAVAAATQLRGTALNEAHILSHSPSLVTADGALDLEALVYMLFRLEEPAF